MGLLAPGRNLNLNPARSFGSRHRAPLHRAPLHRGEVGYVSRARPTESAALTAWPAPAPGFLADDSDDFRALAARPRRRAAARRLVRALRSESP